MSSQLPQRCSPAELDRTRPQPTPVRPPEPMPPASRTSPTTPATPGASVAMAFAGGDQLVAPAAPAEIPQGTSRDVTNAPLTIGDIQAERVSVTVNHYHGNVITQTQKRTVQQASWVENRPVYVPRVYVPSAAPESSEGGVLRALLVLVAFAAFVFVLVWAYRTLVNPATTTVIVERTEEPEEPKERPMPRTFLEYVESQGH